MIEVLTHPFLLQLFGLLSSLTVLNFVISRIKARALLKQLEGE